MGAPAPQIPLYNAFRVHFLSQATADCAGTLLSGIKVSTQCFEKRSDFLFDATACILRSEDLVGLEQKPNRNCLLLCQGTGVQVPALGEKIQWPDLWLVENREGGGESGSASEWIYARAGAVVVFGNTSVHWESHNGAFGQSRGNYPVQGVKGSLDFFTAGLVLSLMEELLGETLFDKTGITLDRDCLEMHPLRLGRAVQSGLAAMSGEELDSVRSKLGEWRGPVQQSWRGRIR